jgi:bacillolysin
MGFLSRWCWLTVLVLPLPATLEGSDEVRIATTAAAEVSQWNNKFEQMLRSGELQPKRLHADSLMPGRRHEWLAQLHDGVPVWNAEVVRQIDQNGTIVSVFGTLYQGIGIDSKPLLTPQQAKAAVEKQTGVRLGASMIPTLAILPLDGGGYALTFTLVAAGASDVKRYFIDAGTGEVVLDYSVLERQAAEPVVGLGTGVLNDEEKLSVASENGQFVAVDLIRPARVLTYNLKGQQGRITDLFNGADLNGADLATSADLLNWTDGPVVDGHAFAGFFYDFFFKRFGRRSWNDSDGPLRIVVHPAKQQLIAVEPPSIVNLLYFNAFYCCQALGGYVIFGEGAPQGTLRGSQQWLPLAGGLDLVGHEMTHGMTANTSGLDEHGLESGALSESFCDQMGTGIEFFFHASKADYRIGEDVIQGVQGALSGTRDMANPGLFGDPDNVQAVKPQNLEVHSLAGIPNQAFYLAIEGGTNRTSGRVVQGVGAANRDQIEKVFYRAFQFMLTPTSNFRTAATACVASAQQLYGVGSSVDQAVSQAWAAVGVQP